MDNQKVLAKFVKKAPFAVMTRLLVDTFLSNEADQLFEANRQDQYTQEVTFAALSLAVADVTLDFCGSFHQAHEAHRRTLEVAASSFYEKLNGTELPVSEAVVAKSAKVAGEMLKGLGFTPWEIVPGYRFYGVDGNVLAKTEKRQGVLRDSTAAPLPGKVVAKFDLQRQLFVGAYLLEDAHAQESTTCDRLADDIRPNDVIVADRHYCIVRFMERLAAKLGFFIIRQHGRLKGKLIGRRRRAGRTDTGLVYEQDLQLSGADHAMVVRRITIELDRPTRDGDMQIHLLTNLPADVKGTTVADTYRLRWEEENAFHVLQMTLTCEIASVSHPRAALFLFCMAMTAYNFRQVTFAALFAEHPQEQVEQVSHFKISREVTRYTEGLRVALDDEEWRDLMPTTVPDTAQTLREIAKGIDLKRYKKSHRGPKKKKPDRSRNSPQAHVSTARLLGIV